VEIRTGGNGEPTLHPSFSEFIKELSGATCDLELTSNWQRISEPLARSVAEAKISRLHISIDGASKANYEKHRLGGSWEELLANLTLLKRVRQDYSPRAFVNIRVMMRPSDHGQEEPFKAFWADYGDEVTTQYVTDWAGTDTDVFALQCGVGVYPHCTLPFKQIEVHWNGNVPLCTYSQVQSGRAEGLLLGNIQDDTLAAMWNSDTMRGYREGHRQRNPALMPICEGCAVRTRSWRHGRLRTAIDPRRAAN
jgi:MoaA/NifB/PqqE/SkfB family radical SAM enzyme